MRLLLFGALIGINCVQNTTNYFIFNASAAQPRRKRLARVQFRKLTIMAQKISAEVTNCWGFDQALSSRQFRNGEWQHITNDLAVLPHTMCISDNEFGNHLGNLLNDLACANIIGAHFVTVYHQLFVHADDEHAIDAHDIETDVDARRLYTFVKYLPHVVMHPKAALLESSQKAVDKVCKCTGLCWEDPQAPWLCRQDYISKFLRIAIHNYVRAMKLESIGTVVQEDDIVSSVSGTHHSFHHNTSSLSTTPSTTRPAVLPLLPNVTIQYRCGDNINFKQGKYGLASFKFFTRERILGLGDLSERDIQYIYVLTENRSRSRSGPCPSCCNTILSKLHAQLSSMFPLAVVLVKRGGDIFADYARLAFSNVVFCSASTFCLWPALANDKGRVLLPYTRLFGGADNASVVPDLGGKKHFVDVGMVSTFNGSEDELNAAVVELS